MAGTDPLTGARLGDMNDGPLGGLYLAEVVDDLSSFTIPRFATVADRDTAYQAWVTAGHTMVDGMTCWCDVPGARYERVGGEWVSFKKPTTLRDVGRQANNVLTGGSQAYGSSSAGRIVVPAASNARLARIDADIDVWCPGTSASAGSVRLYANSTELLPNPDDWGSFHNLVSTNTYAARTATAHIRWEGTLPAAAQNLWVNVVSDAGTAAFWVTGFDMTAVYR